MDKIRDLREKFFLIDDEYLNGYAKLCGINATGVYLSMCRHANKQQQCFPSKKLIAGELDISQRSVYNAIKKLEEWGIVEVEEQGRKKDGSFKVKIYTLLDKKYWKEKPQANGADGKKRQDPQANDDTPPQARGAQEGNTVFNQTHIKETHSSSTKKTERKRSEPRKDIDFLLKSLESLLGIIDETQKGRRQWAKLFLDSKIPEIYQRKHSRPPTSQEAINSTVLIFKLAHESSDKYIQTNSSSLQWVYRNIGKILNNKAVNAPKVAFIS